MEGISRQCIAQAIQEGAGIFKNSGDLLDFKTNDSHYKLVFKDETINEGIKNLVAQMKIKETVVPNATLCLKIEISYDLVNNHFANRLLNIVLFQKAFEIKSKEFIDKMLYRITKWG